MPTYQYLCTQCGEAMDVQQSFTDDALTVCPQCDGRLRKVFNAVGVVFKGSGFYHNDSRSTGTSSLPAGKSESHGSESHASESSGSGSTGSSAQGDSGAVKTEKKAEKPAAKADASPAV